MTTREEIQVPPAGATNNAWEKRRGRGVGLGIARTAQSERAGAPGATVFRAGISAALGQDRETEAEWWWWWWTDGARRSLFLDSSGRRGH